MDKKVDVKKFQFGSKIDQSDAKRDELFGVKRVISPDKIELSNGLIVRLIGIQPNPQHQAEAIDFFTGEIPKEKSVLEI